MKHPRGHPILSSEISGRALESWSSGLERHHGAASLRTFDQGHDVSTPSIQGGTLLCGPLVSLVDPNDPGPASGDVVEHRLRHLQPHPEALQSGRQGSAQVMQAPVLDPRRCVQPPLAGAPTVEGAIAAWKYEVALPERGNQVP